MVRAVLVVAIVLVIAVPTIAATIWGLGKQASASARVVGMPDMAPEWGVIGSFTSGTASTTAPLARLEFFSWGIRLSGRVRRARWILPPWEARYEELATIRPVSIMLRTGGIRLAVKDSADAVVFWSAVSTEILNRLAAHGVPTERQVTRLRAGDLYRTW